MDTLHGNHQNRLLDDDLMNLKQAARVDRLQRGQLNYSG
jgi:hypothetical protein